MSYLFELMGFLTVEEKCFSGTEKSPASTIFGRNFGFDVDFGA